MVKPSIESRLSPETWADAALEAIARGGIDAVAVEPIAALLGVTKGSFYWHFKNRSELLEAALHRWEVRATGQIIEQLSDIANPAERLQQLMRAAFGDVEGNRGENAIFGAVSDPVVAAAVVRVNAQRLAFLERAFLDLGFRTATARMRARIAYAAYLGHVTLQMTDSHGLRSLSAYSDELIAVLTAD
jgi:AcrR family transcriptional regulator